MRVLAITDIHKDENALTRTLRFIDEYKSDILLILGDITTFGPLSFAEKFIAGLPDMNILALPGNCDPREILSVLDDSKAINLHRGKETIDGITFVGLGGSNDTPFNTPFELTEAEIFSALDNLMEPGAILVLHGPAKGHLDKVPGGHTGSTGALKIVEKYRPSLVLAGHIHETTGTDRDEHGVIYVNPGPMRDGHAAIVDIEFRNQEREGKNKYRCEIRLLPE